MLIEEHEHALLRRLNGVSKAVRAGFAAVCAERLFASVPTSVPEEVRSDLQKAITVVWDRVKGLTVPAPVVEEVSQKLARLVVADDASRATESNAALQEALAAAVYATRQLQDSGHQNAVWAARQLTDSVDRRLQAFVDARLLGRDDEFALSEHAEVRSELERQQRYLARVVAAEGDAKALEELRLEARADPPKIGTRGRGTEGDEQSA